MQPRYQNVEKRVGRQRNPTAASIGRERESQLEVCEEWSSIPNSLKRAGADAMMAHGYVGG